MAETQPTLRDFLILSHPDQIRVLAHPARQAILRLLCDEPMTASQVAVRLNTQANHAHYHLLRLLEVALVVETTRGPKRRREERFFLAAARQFVVDPALGVTDPETTRRLRSDAELSFLDWRRREVLNIDFRSLATKVVQDCLRARAGERVLVVIMPPALELGEAVLVELRAIGARPTASFWGRNTVLRTLDRESLASLARFHFVHPDDDAATDAVIFLTTSNPQGAPPSTDQLTKLPLYMDAFGRWQTSMRRRGVRLLEVALPHWSGLAGGDLSPEDGLNMYWRSLDADYSMLELSAGRLLRMLSGDGQLSFRDDQGSELSVTVDVHSSHTKDGVLSDADLERGQCSEELPAGSLVLLPIRGTASGIYRSNYAYFGGTHVRGIEVELASGRIVSYRAREGEEALRTRIGNAVGEWDVIGAVRFGLNPSGQGLSGVPAVDACRRGVVTLDFGNNTYLGGDVHSSQAFHFPNAQATVLSGERTLLREGQIEFA